MKNGAGGQGSTLAEQIHMHASLCKDCKLCLRECLFLQGHGSPKTIAEQVDPGDSQSLTMALAAVSAGFAQPSARRGSIRPDCFLPCGVRPSGRDMSILRDTRGFSVTRNSGHRPFSACTVCLKTVRRCFSRLYFRRDKSRNPEKLFRLLQERIPRLGIVLDCCAKPSHDLGCQERFQEIFGEMKRYLVARGVKTVLVACPSCHRVFSRYGDPLKVQTVYEEMAVDGSYSGRFRATVTVHDPCIMREARTVQEAVRSLLAQRGVDIVEMDHRGAKTTCCGEGGAVGFFRPELANAWRGRRREEAAGNRIITYCAGCVNYLGRDAAAHVLDLWFESEDKVSGGAKAAAAPWSYLYRLWLKFAFRKMLSGATCVCRPLP